VARLVEAEFGGDRLAGVRLAQAYALLESLGHKVLLEELPQAA
jgi:hypothetical protein